MSAAKLTTDHKTIKQWVKTRDGKPATVKGTGDGQPGVLQIDFPGYSGVEDLKTIQWNAFFKKFDKENLAFLYKEKTDGNVSRFCKLVHAPQGVLQTLHEEHEKVLGLLEDASETTTRALKTRPRLLESLREALLPHMAGEEKVVYKVIKKQA
ncbi:MAG: hemerythrin domain-containing protein, partial [Planctomycetota bacterium]